MNTLKNFGRLKFFSGLLVGISLFGSSAFAYNSYISNNTPSGGYLLCANSKTKIVTFPNKLVCTSGTVPLDIGAASGSEGPVGPEGPQGPAGPAGPAGVQGLPGISSGGKLYWSTSANSIDIVADGQINSSSSMVKKVIFILKNTDVPDGYYKLTGHISGLWADSANVGSLVQCFFQSATDYDANGSQKWGRDSSERQSWNNVDLNVLGDWSPSLEKSIYLVCRTSGTLKGINVEVDVESATLSGKIGSSSVA